MSLSRLIPNSADTSLAQRNRKKGQADQFRHLRLWEAIRRTRAELNEGQQRIDQIGAQFNSLIVPREERLTRVVAQLTGKLISHFSARELDTADQSLLGLWITENLQSLHGHPFSSEQEVASLIQEWRLIIRHDGPIENQLARLARKMGKQLDTSESDQTESSGNRNAHNQTCPGNTPVDAADTTDESFVEDSGEGHKGATENRQKTSDSRTGAGSGTGTESAEHAEPALADDLDKIDLEQKLSVERLFRQLAAILHPDKEPDETLRQEKHELMSQCLEARKNKDIDTLLSLYCEHIGELPDDLTAHSHKDLIKALETQLHQLQNQLRQQRFGNPILSMVIDRYTASDPQDHESQMASHAASLDVEIEAMETLYRQLNSFDGLLDSLDERRAIEQDRLAIDEMTGVSPGILF